MNKALRKEIHLVVVLSLIVIVVMIGQRFGFSPTALKGSLSSSVICIPSVGSCNAVTCLQETTTGAIDTDGNCEVISNICDNPEDVCTYLSCNWADETADPPVNRCNCGREAEVNALGPLIGCGFAAPLVEYSSYVNLNACTLGCNVFDGTDADCGLTIACGGRCPAGEVCGSDAAGCVCTPDVPCGDTAPACNGTCPSGESCFVTGSGVCGCVSDASYTCKNSDIAVCNTGTCPANYRCGDIFDSPPPCFCQQVSCGETYPTCGGYCLLGGTCITDLVNLTCVCLDASSSSSSSSSDDASSSSSSSEDSSSSDDSSSSSSSSSEDSSNSSFSAPPSFMMPGTPENSPSSEPSWWMFW